MGASNKEILKYIAASPAKEHGGFDERTVEAAKWALQEIARLTKWVNDLQSGMYINCVYCGHRYGPREGTPVAMADVLREHIEKCPKHPLSAAKAEIEHLTKMLRSMEDIQAGRVRPIEDVTRQFQDSERLRRVVAYLDDPQVLLAIPQPHRMKLSELLHGRESEASDGQKEGQEK